MKCPKCHQPMLALKYGSGDRKVHRCSHCSGLWFKPLDLQRLKNTYRAEFIDQGSAMMGRAYNKVEDICCPICDSSMDKVSDDKQTHIWYESCPQGHGVYFDAGELTDLSQNTFMDHVKKWLTSKR